MVTGAMPFLVLIRLLMQHLLLLTHLLTIYVLLGVIVLVKRWMTSRGLIALLMTRMPLPLMLLGGPRMNWWQEGFGLLRILCIDLITWSVPTCMLGVRLWTYRPNVNPLWNWVMILGGP